MTRIIKLIAILCIAPLLVWACFGFIVWNWNPETWSPDGRCFFVWLSTMLLALMGLLQVEKP